MKKLSQKQVWNAISSGWKIYRSKTLKEVEEFLEGKKGKILDLGCGSGRNFLANPELEWYAVDFSNKMLKYARQNAKKNKIRVKFFKASAERLPFSSNFFDASLFISTLHCIPGKENRKKALSELYRVMKKNAEVMITVWNKKTSNLLNIGKEFYLPWRSKGEEYRRYIYLYDEKELKSLFKKIGFRILRGKYEIKDKHSKKNIITYCKK